MEHLNALSIRNTIVTQREGKVQYDNRAVLR
jgi:hypothetical protein